MPHISTSSSPRADLADLFGSPVIQTRQAQSERNYLLRRALAALAAAACFAAAMLALSWSWADLTVTATRAPEQLKRLERMTPERWRAAFARLHQARALNPLKAQYAAELGRHHAWLAWRSLGVAEASRSYRRNSEEAFGEAISRRPSWGYAWANYAEARLLQGLADERTLAATHRAMTLSPWEPGTHQKSLLLAFSLWNALDQRQRELTSETLRRALYAGVELELIIRMAVQSGREKMVKEMLTQSDHRRLLEELIAQGEH